jgi:hypothetical protein
VDDPAAPTTFPAGVEWVTENAYGEKGKGLVSRYDTDGDGLYGADEFLNYGTLRYDARTRFGILPPAVCRVCSFGVLTGRGAGDRLWGYGITQEVCTGGRGVSA